MSGSLGVFSERNGVFSWWEVVGVASGATELAAMAPLPVSYLALDATFYLCMQEKHKKIRKEEYKQSRQYRLKRGIGKN
jgi:hypothetical protein